MIPYQVPRDELLVLADGERHLARRVDRHVDDAALEQKEVSAFLWNLALMIVGKNCPLVRIGDWIFISYDHNFIM